MFANSEYIRDIKAEVVNDDIITPEAVKEITKCLIKKGLMKNVAIFIDFDNIYYSLRDYGIDINDERYDLCNFLAETYNTNITRKFRAYADFQQVDVNLTRLQELRIQIRHVYGNSKEEKYRKNASDIELSLDAIETYYKNPDIDTYIFVTCDSDMIPIMSRLKYKGKQVHLFYIGANISQEQHITSYADVAYDIIEIFQIDIKKNDPNHWLPKAIAAFKAGYNRAANRGKYYGGSWAHNDIVNKCGITYNLAGDVLELMIVQKFVNKIKNADGLLLYEPTEKLINYEYEGNNISASTDEETIKKS